MKKTYLGLTLMAACFQSGYAQNELHNTGSQIFVAKGAWVHVNREINNQGKNSDFQIDGVVQLTGDFTNSAIAGNKGGTDVTGEITL